MTIEAHLQSIDASLQTIAISLEKLAGDPPAPAKPGTKKTTKASTSSKSSSKTSTKQSDKPKPEKPSPEKDAKDEGPSLAEVRRALTSLQKREDPDAARGVLKEIGGVTTLSKLPEEKYQEVIDAAAE